MSAKSGFLWALVVSQFIFSLNRWTWRVLLALLCVSGILAYSALDRTAVLTEEMLVIPGSVTAVGFTNFESVLIHDLDGEATYNNFLTSNAAVLKPTIAETEGPVPSTPDFVSPDSSEAPTESSTEGAAPTPSLEVPPANDSVPVNESDAPAVDTTEPVSAVGGAPIFAVTTTTARFPWAQFDATSEVAAEPVTQSETITEVASDVVVPSEPTEAVTTTEVPAESMQTDVPTEVQTATSTEAPAEAEPSSVSETNVETVDTACTLMDCTLGELVFRNFALPELSSGSFLESVQVRMSLAARAKNDSQVQEFRVYYALDGVTFIPATTIDVEDEVSNNINGDHFLVSLALPSYTRDISALAVKIVYEGVTADLEAAYVDALWLEVTSQSFYELSDIATSSDAITYERDLALPTYNKFMGADTDVVLGTTPEFTFEYQLQQNFFRRVFNQLFGTTTFTVKSIALEHATFGPVSDIPYEVIYHEDQTWSLKLPKSPQKMQPGKYRVAITIAESDTVYTDTFEFYWGVLAVNTTKSRYEPNQEVKFELAALTDEGDTICNANLQLQVVTPDNEFFDIPVAQSGACGFNNVTTIPDYTATFTNTAIVGTYQIRLAHLNTDGEVVHRIVDGFTVEEFIPYDIERKAPTRIYPPATYEVEITIKANRSFSGPVTETVPRGFILEDFTAGGSVITYDDRTLLQWDNVMMAEGETRTFVYRFDAPDVSPYLYLLGPLSLDGYEEGRAWQIASDALSGIGWFNGTRTVAGTNLNAAASPLQWSTSSIDTYYYQHSTSSQSERIILRQDGDYFLAVTLPVQRIDGTGATVRTGIEVRVNGVVRPEGIGRSALTRNANGQNESSSHVNVLLNDISANDYVEIFAETVTTVNGALTVNVTNQASAYFEYLGDTESVFAATTTRTVASTTINATSSPLTWSETRQDGGFVHSDTINPENIIISNPGTYLVHVNIPVTAATSSNVRGRVLLDGQQVPSGIMAQGFLLGPASNNDRFSSVHWSGVVVATTSNQVLSIVTEQEATFLAPMTVTAGTVGSIVVQALPTDRVFTARGTNLLVGSNWNTATTSILWQTVEATSTTFSHSPITNSHQITVTEAGDYYLVYNGSASSTVTNSNHRIQVLVNGSTTPAVRGARTASNLITNQLGHNESSSMLNFLIQGLAVNDVITVVTGIEANGGTVNDQSDSQIFLWKRLDFNARPDAPTLFDIPFNNILFSSTTPYFEFQSVDSDGTSDLQYQIAIATSSNFSNAIVRTSGVDTGFTNLASTTASSPYTEGERIRFQLQAADELSDTTTYYWRVRARDVTGSTFYGDWTPTQSLSVNRANTVPSWYQSFTGQFAGNALIGTVSQGTDRIQVDAAPSQELLTVYGEGTVSTPRYRVWNGTNWGAEQNAIAVGGTINWIDTAAAVNRDEYIAVTLDTSSTTYAQVYSASTSSWGNQAIITSGVIAPQYRGMAVAYENSSGDAIVVSCANGPDPVFRVWNGSTWSATGTINVSSLNNCNFVSLASDPNSDEMVVVVRDTGTQYEAQVWDGNAWGNGRVIGSSAVLAREGIAVNYEASGDQAVVAVSNGTNSSFLYAVWDGTTWSTNATHPLGDDFAFGKLANDTNSDSLLFCYIDADNDIGVVRWDGGVWNTFTELDIDGNSNLGRPLSCLFESSPGRTDIQMITYSDGVGLRFRTATSGAWSAEGTVSTLEDSFWVQTTRAGDGTIVTMNLDDVIDDILTSSWNGSSWSPSDTLETNPSSLLGAPYEIFDVVAKRFQFTSGTVRTQPINFTAVPNQIRWGDITFSSSEPFGTDVLVRVRFTSTTTCDSYIPDAALPGNLAGFGTEELPINLGTLSTTTYTQLCLEATLTTQGSTSASLDDWTLSWVREAKLIQNAYRWFANLSNFTPTDPWPVGAADLAELNPITSAAPVSNNDVVRLRIGLENSNVSLATSTRAFKLQFAPGSSCSLTSAWQDVGAVGSTTAPWRGFANSIVGSDWYASAWPRRVKVSVENTLVSGTDITNFPVFVNLDDLPAVFFDHVQNDGDDIRVTASDGITEVPFELVSIDTVNDIGELHFRASSLSTTTDTEFYIYYGNPSASGYAATAPFGRNNVWSNNFLAVYHLDQSPTASAPQFIDSTGSSNGTSQNMEAGDRRTGIVGRFQDLDGANEFIDLGATFNRSFLNSTWQIWASTSANQGTFDGLLMSRAAGETSGINISSNAGNLGYHWRDASNTWSWTGGPSYPTSSAPFMATLTIEPTRAVLWRHAGNGVASGTNAVAHATGTYNALDFGQDPLGGRLWAGGIDEVQISSVVRSNGWIQTTYHNKSNPTGFYAVAAEELIGDGRRLPSVVLTASDFPETYEENNPTTNNRNGAAVGQSLEWDFVIQNNGATPNTNYCFRLVNADGSVVSSYVEYPRLITNAPPLPPDLTAPFDNERLASTSPWFEFSATDESGNVVSYEVQIDDNADFSSPTVTRESNANFPDFTNLTDLSERSQYTQGQTIRFVPPSGLTNGVTYYWRVRARDDFGSGAQGLWSTVRSFTLDTSTTITTWFQTTGEQFATNATLDIQTSTTTNDSRIDVGLTSGTTTSTVIDYDDRDRGNTWGSVSFNQNVTSGTIRYYVEYRVSGENFELVPDAVLAGNSAGFTSSPISLAGLNPNVYNELRLVAAFTGTDNFPRLLDWTVTWGVTIDAPTVVQPFDNAKVATVTPSFTFVTSDPENQDLVYELQLSTTSSFAASSTFQSDSAAGFVNTVTATDTSPFISNQIIRYTAQTPLTNGVTYWWRTRARDPGGANAWSSYSEPVSFTVDTAITVSTWHQTTGDQFGTNILTDIETTSGGARITSTLRGVVMAWGEGTGQAPRYRVFDGTGWGGIQTAASVGAQIRWTELKANTQRPEYALMTIGSDNDVNVQIYNSEADTWGNVRSLEENLSDITRRGADIAFEQSSGDLVAVSCSGTDAVFATWNGSVWSATSSIPLSNPLNCHWVQLAADPTSNEIVAVFRHTNATSSDYEAMVWDGSSWGNAVQFGDMVEDANEGMAVEYEVSGDQAMVAVSGTGTTLIWRTWNGTTWSATSSTALGSHIEWASIARDTDTDRLALCYVDNDTDLGVIRWNGSAWGTFAELDQTGNAKTAQPIDCQFETAGSRDGFLMVPYSDGTNGRYQFATTTTGAFNGELTLSTMEDSARVIAVRAGDGTIHAAFLDDTNNRIDYSRWDGTTWTPRQTNTNPSFTGGAIIGVFSMAAQEYPSFTAGTIRSTPIRFSDGAGPRWERFLWNDTTPGSSDIRYRLFYLATSSQFIRVPDSALAGNSSGFTASPISIAGLDRTVYSVLRLEAELDCAGVDCPTIQDWSLEWSEGISVSGRAFEYDGVATTTSGTVAVAVNGALQPGKTGTILGDGTWSITNVSAFPGDTIVIYVDGASEADEAISVTTYDGIGDVINMELTKRHLTVGSSDNATTTNARLFGFDGSDDEDIFFDVLAGSIVDMCAFGCGDSRLKVRSGAVYQPTANMTVHDVLNQGTLLLGTSTYLVRGSWTATGTTTPLTSTVILSAATSSESITTSSSSATFFNLTFGVSTSTGTFSFGGSLDIDGTLRLEGGTTTRGTSSIAIGRDAFIASGARLIGIGTTTFDGTGSFVWTDLTASGTNLGNVVVDGTAKTITLGSAVTAESITIGADDTLNASGSGFALNVWRNWTNNNLFVPQSGTVNFIGTSTGVIARGTSAFNNLQFTGVGGNWSFSTSTLLLNGSLTIATGTVTMPTGTTTIAGSFTAAGGTFAHNNGEIRFTSTIAGRTIQTNGTAFLNAFYDVVFAGSGSWIFNGAATSSRDFRITAGSVNLPTTTLTVGGDYLTSGAGSFAHNNGEVVLLVQTSDDVTTNGSSFNNVRVRGNGTGGWYNAAWSNRVPVTIPASQVGETVTNFPVYVNLATLPAAFFTVVASSGADIRVTESDGITEVPVEVVSVSTSTQSGEIHFRATSLSATTSSTFYVYYGNANAVLPAATAPFGRNNVWSNNYLAVYHLDENPTAATPQYISSNGTTTGTANAMEAGDQTAAQIGRGQNIDGAAEFIQSDFASNMTTSTWSIWIRPNGVQGAYDGLVFSRSGQTTGLNLTADGTRFGYHWNDAVPTYSWNGGPTVLVNQWQLASLVVTPTSATMYRFATSGNASGTVANTHTVSTINDLKFGQDDAGSRFFNGIIDEIRLSSVARSQGWLQTEFNNQASSSAFATVGGVESSFARVFAETNTTILGNYISDVGGDARFPSGVLSVGGTFDNNARFFANNGTVRFNSPAGSETIAAGTSSFATLEITGSSSDYTIIENATATVAILLTNANQFTVSTGVTLATLGTFTTAIPNANTTWTGSTLALLGSDHSINTKSHGGDTFAVLRADADTDIALWNSTAASFVTASTSSFYSQDHSGIDGDLEIYGNYVRTSGTEHWAANTDFDGASITPRQVDVRLASGTSVGLVNSSWSIRGTSTASTTITALSGTYAITATNTTVNAEFFAVANTGLGITFAASSTLATFRDGFITVLNGENGLRFDTPTIQQNNTVQFERIGFATTSGVGTNVAMVGTTTSFVWFRNGYGNLYGEAFDSNDGNPGSIRFDDSSYLITVSGRVLANDGSANLGAPTCNGASTTVRLVVDSGSFASSTSCNAATGAYSFSNVSFTGDPRIIVYLDTNGGAVGTVITKTPTGNITNLDLYTNQVILRSEVATPVAISDLTRFTNNNDTDIRFTATTSPTSSLSVLPGSGLFVWASTTFTPAGEFTLNGNASSSAFEGTLTLATSSRFVANATETYRLAGRLVVGSNASVTPASSTILFTATTTGKSITSAATVNLHNVSFTGVGGAWNITAPLSLTGTLTAATGTVTGTSNLTLLFGAFTGDGTVSLGGGTTTLAQTSTFGGVRPWTVFNLALGTGANVGTTSLASAATTTIAGRLSIAAAHVFTPGSGRLDLSGTGTVFVNNGTFTSGTSLVRYSGANASVLGTTYHDLWVGAAVGSSTYTGTGLGILVNNDMTIGNGTASSTFTLLINDPVLTIARNVVIAASSTLSASDIATTTITGSYDNNGRFFGNNGTVLFNGATSNTIAAGVSSFSNLIINGTGSFTVPESATTTGRAELQAHSNFTLATGTSFAVGGGFRNGVGGSSTAWPGTLALFGGGSQSISASTTADTYSTLFVATGTRVRMWNSSASTYVINGGLYSQDHANTNGLLHIYGTFDETSAQDHWSFATDFDGTPLTGTSTRAVTVRFATSSIARWTGGSLSVIGTSTASTSIQNQGGGTYNLTIGGTASTTFSHVVLRNMVSAGITLTGTPTVVDFSRTDIEVGINSGTGMTVGGTVLNANEARNFTNNVFNAAGGVIGATNVTATGTAISSWRFTNHAGNLDGEALDVDPAGDPGYLVWDDSAALITVSGNVYSDEGTTVSGVCDGVTNNITLRVAGLTSYSTSCNASTGAYSISGVAYNSLDSLVVYIDGATPKAAHVTKSPISSISSLHLYENRVIVRHENIDPITIADMAIWDSSDDADIPFTAIDAGSDTLTLPSDRKLIIWTGKTFAPNGNVTVTGNGGGTALDGTLEALVNARFRQAAGETHTIGGNFIFGTGAILEGSTATTTFTANTGSRTIDVNGTNFGSVAVTGGATFTVTDSTFTTNRSFSQSAGVVNFGAGTTTIGASFNATAGNFSMPSVALVFTSTSTGNTIRFDESTVPTVRFTGNGSSFTMADTNATSTGSLLIVSSAALTLPSGVLAIGGSFDNASGTVTHNTADIVLTGTTSNSVRAGGSDLFALRKRGTGTTTIQDTSITFRDDVEIATGTLVGAASTTAIAGSLTNLGRFESATSTILFNATALGKTINFGSSTAFNVVIGSASGGFTWLGNATTTNNFSLSAANSFTKEANTTLAVGGVFTNSVGGAATTWSTTTLRLYGSSPYTINTKAVGGDAYATLDIASTTVRAWNSSASAVNANNTSAFYSQDDAAVDGALAIYGHFRLATSTEHWSFATDFDGVALSGGSSRAVNVRFGPQATTTVESGTLNIVGSSSAPTTLARQSTGTFGLVVLGGTLNATQYQSRDTNAAGWQLLGTSTIANLSFGTFDIGVNGGTAISVASTTLNANASKVFTNVNFTATTSWSGVNVALTGSTSNAWRFTLGTGNLYGEAFDSDGIDACGAIRFDDSACLQTAQTAFRWRNDDGNDGVPNSEWFDTSFDYRERVRIEHTSTSSFATTSVKLTVPYDTGMQSDFDDLRFTLADGVTPTNYWRERVVASTEAVVWVVVPSLPAGQAATVFMYFGSSTAVTASNATGTFAYIDSFEDNNISEYSGDLSLFMTDTAPVYGGTYALEAVTKNARASDGIFRTDVTVSQGQVLRWMQYVDTTAGTSDEVCTLFGVQSPGTNNNNYGVCLEQFGTDRLSLSRNVIDNDVSGTVLASTTVTFTTGWYEVQVDWRTNNRIEVYLFNPSGTLVATTSATDSTYTSGGVGFTFWVNNGAWDSYTARNRGPISPTVHFGARQSDGGASWNAAQNTFGTGLPGDVRRLRIAIENSGLTVSGQTYRLQYAAKGAAPSCEAVSTANYIAVPNQASCGSSPLCMQSSTQVTDGASSVDLLTGLRGQFTSGFIVENPSNMASALTLNQSTYTEIEYVLTPTVNASDAYCLRVVNNTTPLDFYGEVAELALQFDPTFGPVTLNNGQPIVLTPNATTTIFATGTVTDFNGVADLVRGTSTIYRSGAGPTCTADNNNCYIAQTGGSCSFTNCSANTCTLTCRADIFFHADPTDIGTFSGQEWLAYLEVSDAGGGYDFASAPGVELLTLRALSVDSNINYGALEIAADTGAFNPTTTIANTGNVPFDIEVLGTDLSDGLTSVIPSNEQKFATSTFTYAACTVCSLLSSTTPTEVAVNLSKPTVNIPPVTTSIYWGVEIPFGAASRPHQGMNVFTPVSP